MIVNRILKYIIVAVICVLLAFAIALAAHALFGNSKPTTRSTPCILTANSDHAMMVKIYSPTAQDICSKISDHSNGLWNVAFTEPQGVVACSVELGHALFKVYDPGLSAQTDLAQSYAVQVVCPILKHDRRLLGQGY